MKIVKSRKQPGYKIEPAAKKIYSNKTQAIRERMNKMNVIEKGGSHE